MWSRIKNSLAGLRSWFRGVCILQDGHWSWMGIGIAFLCLLLFAGMMIDMGTAYGLFPHFAAFLFFFILPFLSGLGARLGLRIVNLIPVHAAWWFFGAVFFVLFLFHFSAMAMLLLIAILMFTGLSLGGSLYNLSGGRWWRLNRGQKVFTFVFLVLGLGMFSAAAVFLLGPGRASPAVKNQNFSLPLTDIREHPDPLLRGNFRIDSLIYGWPGDHRHEFGRDADIPSSTVDGSNFLDGWEKLSGKLRSRFWKMSPDSLALNGRVWFPEGPGPFPVVLLVHGNHGDRQYSDPGYDYLARHLASHGMIAVSIDQNFLNGAWSDIPEGLKTENDCRGWLLLKHLELWRDWNGDERNRFYGKADLDKVMLIGHSRGGEAVSIAACFNDLPCYPDNSQEEFNFGFGIRGVAAIAPVDGQYYPAGIRTPLQDINYFTLQGSMDADLTSFQGLRQMRRVRFTDSAYHFAAALYLHGANHGQFNRSWGVYDYGFPIKLFLNRRDIIPPEKQEKVALAYLTAFSLESLDPGSGFLPLFKDAREGRDFLPDLILLNQFQESGTHVLCSYEEDLDLKTGSSLVVDIHSEGLATWKEGRIKLRWGDLENNAVYLGWNNEKDSIPGLYRINLDTTKMSELEAATSLSFLIGEAIDNPGDRPGEEGDSILLDNDVGEIGREETEEDETKDPVDFDILIVDLTGKEHRVALGTKILLQSPLEPRVFKSNIFREGPDAEEMMQYVSIPFEEFCIPPDSVSSIIFEFNQEGSGMVLIDQLAIS